MNNSLRQRIHYANQIEHDAIAKHHNKNVPYYNSKSARQRYETVIKSSFLSAIGAADNADVLELGCGTGFFSQVFPDTTTYTGIDISKEMIRIASESYTDPSRSIIFRQCAVEDLVCERKQYDFIFSTSFIHHLYDIESFRSTIKSLLKNPESVYLALHEPIVPKRQALMDKIDTSCAMLRGKYMGESAFPLRLFYTLCGYFNRDLYGEPRPWLDGQKLLRFLRDLRNKIQNKIAMKRISLLKTTM